tara:strand:+ start:7017 stop:14294 length:7278 start_codon:yes stop_codon:yes gene_type:complete
MANPFKNLFKSKYTTFYSVDDLNEEQKNYIRNEYAKYQANPEQFDEQYGTAIVELENRLRTPDPLLRTYESIEDDTTGRGAFQQRRTVGDKRLRVAAEAKGRKKLKTSYLYGQIEDYEPKNSLTDVQSVIDQKEDKGEIQKAVQEIDNKKREYYAERFGYDLYEDNGNQAWKQWIEAVRDDPSLLEKVLQKSPKITEAAREKPGIEESMLRKKWQNSLQKGTLEEDFYDIDIKDLQRAQEERNKKVFGVSDAIADIKNNWEKYIPGGGFIEAKELLDIYDLSKRFDENPSSLSDEEFNQLKNWVEYQDFQSTATWSAQLVQMLAQMPSFGIEIAASGGAVSIASKAGREATITAMQKYLNEGLKRKVRNEVKERTALKVAKSAGTKVAITTVGTSLSGDVEVNKIRNLMPGYEQLDGELFKIYNGMDELSAERQAYWGTFLEFGSEQIGGVPARFAKYVNKTKVGKYTGKKFSKAWNKLNLPNKEYLMSTAAMRAFKNANPNASNKDIEKIFRTFGYHGVIEEMFEERASDAGRHILNLLSTTKDENGKPLIEGFENKNWQWQNPTWEQLSLELVAFSVPGFAKRKLSQTYNNIYEAKQNKKIEDFNNRNKDFGEKITEVEQEVENNEVRLGELSNKIEEGGIESLEQEEIVEIKTIMETKQKKNVLQFMRDLIIRDPSLEKEVDLDINLDQEMQRTKEQLEQEGVSLEGEGLSGDIKSVNVLGFTMFNNLKLKFGLRKGADLDTAIEEYYGAYYRGGLTEEQSDTFEQHYDRYESDESYRIEVNEFINDMMEDMGMSDKKIADVSQTLTEQELFEKEGKSYEYKSTQEERGGIADKTFQFISNMFNRAFKSVNVSAGVADIYKQVQKRKERISAERAQKLEARRAKRQERQEEKQAKREAKETAKKEKQEAKETEKQEKRKAKETAKEEKREAKQDRKRKRLRPGVEPTLDERFDDAQYEDLPETTLSDLGPPRRPKTKITEDERFDDAQYDEVAEPELEDLPDIVPPKPKEIKERKKQAKKIKSKPKLFNFLNRRARKLARKKIETISPVAIREVKTKLEQQAPKQVIPDDPRQPLEILRDILGDEQFQDLTGIYTGPIQQIETIEPRIIETLKEKFEPLPYESLDFFDVIPEKKQEQILKEVEKKVGKETIKPIRDLKKPKKPGVRVTEDETFEDATYDNVPETILEELPNLEKPKKRKAKKKDTSYQIVSIDKAENEGTFIIAGDAANLNLKGEQEDFGIRYPRTYKGWAVTKAPATKIKNQADKGNNIIAITTLTDPANSMKNNPTFIEALKRAAIENVGVRKFNQLFKKNKNNIHKTATEAKVNMKQVGRETSVPDFNQIAGKIVAVAEVEDIRTGDDRKIKHPAYDHEINFKSYRELKEPILLKDYVGELKEGDKRIDYPFLMAKTYNLAITNKESPTTNLFKEFLDTGDNSLFNVKTTGIQVASPQIKDIGLDEAVKGIKSKDLINFHRFVADLEVEQGLKSTTKSSLGEWETGAEPSLYTEITSEIDSEQLEYIAAAKGLSRQQLTVLNFKVDEAGPDSMYEVELDVNTANLKTYTKMLTRAGVEFKTLPITGNKFNLVVVDVGNELVDLFKEASDVKEIKQRTGKASFIGSFESRQKADKEYLKIITEYEQKYPERYSAVLRNNISNLRPRFNKNLLPKKQKAPKVSYQLKPTGKPLDIYDEITGKEKFGLRPKGPRKLIKYWESGIIPISTLLKRIDPKIYSFLLKHQYSVAIRTNQAKEDIILLDKMIKRMSKKDQVAFKLAMLNSDGTTLRDLAQKYDKNEDFTKALSNVRQVLDELRDQLIEVGEEVGFIEEYYPRKVTDYDGLITELYGDSEVKALIEKQIAEKEKNEERKLSDSEKADLINKLIRGYSYIKSRPSFIKTRKLDTITPKIAEFYEDPIIQLNNHMERVVERIENKKFLGASETSDESLGDFIQKIIDSGISLTDAQQKDLMRIFGAYFNFEPTNSTLGAIKTGTYGILLGRFTNTITQMQDMVYGIYENKWNQIRTIKNLVNYFKGKIVETERVKRADVGADMIGQEFKIETKSGFEKFMNGSTNIILTGSGFKLMDGLGKSVLINSAIQKYKTKAKKNRLSKKDKDYLKTLFGNSYDQVIEELKEDTSPSEYTENELFIGYATLLKYQPIGRTEVPLKYLESKGGRILYMLRTFSIKQLNVLRDESMDILTGKQVGNEKMALFNLFYLVGLMTMAGAGGDEIKDWIKGKSSSIWDNVQDNLLKIILINKYWTSKVQREAAYKGYIKSTFDNVKNLLISVPPIDVTIDFIQGVTEFIFKEENDKKKSKLTRYIPWIGDVVYSRREWSEFTGVGGRGKDDYTYRELNSLYKKSYTEQKELDKRELRVYTQSLLDALNYPQTKLRKGKEVRKINIEKHYNHLNGKYNIQIGKNSKGKYEKLN